MEVGEILEKVRTEKPLVHHITNWVTISDCANVVKVFGASPVMAHSIEEVSEMTKIASALVLNIGTLTPQLVESMKKAVKTANEKGIPVILDVCGAGATKLRDEKCFELLKETKIDVLKGNASEIARIAGEKVQTKGVEAMEVKKDLVKIAQSLAQKYACIVVITGKEDIVADKGRVLMVANGHQMMSQIVGTGCMAASVIGTFCAVEKDYVKAAAGALACFGVAAELAVEDSRGPMDFKNKLFDEIFNLNQEKVERMTKLR